jgi:hypothetical protein
MGMVRSTYVFYGVLVARHDNTEDEPYTYDLRQKLEERFPNTDRVADNVRWWTAGNYDRNDMYLVIDRDGHNSKEVEPGQRRVIEVDATLHSTRSGQHNLDGWREQLRNAADALELEVLDGPAWFIVPDVS